MAVAALVLSGLSFLLHRYLWARLVRAPEWPAPWGAILTAALVFLAVLIPVTFFAMRSLPRAVNAPMSWVAYTWMGFLLYFFLLIVLSDVGRGVAALFGALPKDPERRLFLSRMIAGGVAGLAGLIGLGGVINVARGFVVQRVRVPLAKLPKSASGYVIVQLSDVHVGPTLGRDFIESIVRETNALTPDLIVITGDLVDGSVEQLREHVAPLRDLKARDGVFFVTGNHEYYSGADEWIAHLATLGIRVDDASSARMLPHHGQDVAKAADGRDPSRALILLAHQPKALKDALAAKVDLQLSGHVHGGQLVPFNWLVRLDQPFVSGLHLVERTWIYVSTGTGYWGPPMRVGPGAELTRVELVSGEA
jgi:predicted MPP superfamily phosphohydrolase